MVVSLLMWFGSSRRDNTNGVASHGVGNEQKTVLNHANDGVSRFTVAFPVVEILDRKSVLEDKTRQVERDAVLRIILRRLAVVPLEVTIIHKYTA